MIQSINNNFFSTIVLSIAFGCMSTSPSMSWEKSSLYKIYSTNLEPENYFGWSVSIYGNKALIGSFGGSEATQIWVKEIRVENEPAQWYRDTILSSSDDIVDHLYGYSVSIYEDYAIVGCPMLNVAGYAYLYNRNWRNGMWSQAAKLTAGVDYNNNDFFGGSVSIHDNIAAVSAWKSNNIGAVYIFYRSFYGVWSLTQKIIAQDSTSFDYFGRSISIGSGIILIGAHCEDDSGYNAGSAYVFITSDGSKWSQEAKLIPNDPYPGDNFGESVALYENTAVIGAKYSEKDKSSSLETGSAYIFVRQPPNEYGLVTWIQETKLESDSLTPYSSFGASVSIARDTIIVGALGEYSNRTGHSAASGCAFIFQRSGKTLSWSQQSRLEPSSGRTGDYYGKAVAIDMNAEIAIVGAYGEDKYCTGCGAVYIYEQTYTQPIQSISGTTIMSIFGQIATTIVLFCLTIVCLHKVYQVACTRAPRVMVSSTNVRPLLGSSRPMNFLRRRGTAPFSRLDADIEHSNNNSHSSNNENSNNNLDPDTEDESSRRNVDLFEMTTFHRRGYLPTLSKE
eukprot:gene7557-15494_t